MNRMIGKRAFVKAALACVITTQAALAHCEEPVASPSWANGRLWVTTGFFSHHFSRDENFNERNTGLGIEYALSESSAIAIGHYDNSVRRASTYLHYVYTPLELGPFRIGGAAGLLDGYPQLRGGRFSPVVLPVATSTFKLFNYDAGINMTYIPTIAGHIKGAVAIQFKLRIG
jgi:hypothetical protein